jgi:hypothetical protein
MTKPITVGELRKLLESYPQDLPVYLEWEGQYIPFDTAERITEEEFTANDERFVCIGADRWDA